MARPSITLIDLLNVVSHSSLPEAKKKWLSYCIHRFSSVFERDIAMEVNETTLLKRPDLHSAGLTAASLANIRTGVRTALRLAYGSSLISVSPSWASAIELLGAWEGPGKKRMIMCIPSFARYCTLTDTGPETVSAETFTSYEEYSIRMLVRDPKLRARQAENAWNTAARVVDGWPQTVIKRPSRLQLSLPLTELPAELVRELEAYRASRGMPVQPTTPVISSGSASAFLALADSNLLRRRAKSEEQDKERKRTIKPLKDKTMRGHLFALRHAASAALRAGRPHTSISTIAQITMLPIVAEAAAEIVRKNNGTDFTVRQRKLFCELRDVRSRWVGTDDEWTRLHATSIMLEDELTKLGVKTSGMSQKTRQRLSVFESSTAVVKLLTLPNRLLMQAESRRKKGQSVRYRDALDVAVAVALMIEFTKPLRLGNLVELRLDWLRLPARRGEPGSLAIPANKVKNGEPLFATLTAYKVSLLRLFIMHYRIHLTNLNNSPYLFPSRTGDKHKDEGSFAKLIVGRIHTLTGLVINIHLLRGITASLLYRKTKNLDDVRALLGHSKDSDAHEFYLYLTQQTASMVLDEAIEAEIGDAVNSRKKL